MPENLPDFKKPEHGEFIEELQKKYTQEEEKPQKKLYHWQIIYLRHALLLGILIGIVLLTFFPLRGMLSKKDYQGEVDKILNSGDYEEAMRIAGEFYKKKHITRAVYYYYQKQATDGKFNALYQQSAALYEKRAYDQAQKVFQAFMNYVYERHSDLGITANVFGAFQREIFDDLKFIPKEKITVKTIEELREKYTVIIDQIANEYEMKHKLAKVLDAVLKLKLIDSMEII